MEEKNQLEIFNDMLKDADEHVIKIRDLTKESLKSVGFKFDVVDIFDHFIKDQVSEFNDAQILAIYADYYDESSGVTYPEEYDERVKMVKDALLSVATECDYYNGVVDRRVELSHQYQSLIDELVAYGESPEGREKAFESYESLKEKLLTETDPDKKAEIETKIKIYEESKSLSFVFDRIDKFSDKELRSISETMFDNGRFRAAMDRCEKVLKKLKIDSKVLPSFVNLEEKFLGEKYYPFNNLFLVFTIRYIGYCDTTKKDNAAFARILVAKLNKLIRHSFPSQEEEDFMVNTIKTFDDKFEEYRDLFEKKNKANPESEYRREINVKKREATIDRIKDIAKENGYNELPDLPYPELVKWGRDIQERGFLVHWFKTFGVYYDESMTLEELREIRDNLRAVVADKRKEVEGLSPLEVNEVADSTEQVETKSMDESNTEETEVVESGMDDVSDELKDTLVQTSGIPVPVDDGRTHCKFS